MDLSTIDKGHLIRINNYEFQDGNGTRDKYLIVLHRNDNEAFILHSLTTTTNNRNFPTTNFGCSVHLNIPFFFIPKDMPIGMEQFYFDEDTFIFFKDNIRKEEIVSFEKYNVNALQMMILDKLPDELLKRILKCLLKSKFVPLNLKPTLETVKSEL